MASRNPIPFISAQLPDGAWVAVHLLPGQYVTGKSQAEAEARIRRKAAKPKAAMTEDEMDIAAIERHRHEPMIPFEVLEKKYCK
jgi:hypothetical protein